MVSFSTAKDVNITLSLVLMCISVIISPKICCANHTIKNNIIIIITFTTTFILRCSTPLLLASLANLPPESPLVEMVVVVLVSSLCRQSSAQPSLWLLQDTAGLQGEEHSADRLQDNHREELQQINNIIIIMFIITYLSFSLATSNTWSRQFLAHFRLSSHTSTMQWLAMVDRLRLG